jgi:1-acyl-sn-glycerol-3-phosphate acyltransferase
MGPLESKPGESLSASTESDEPAVTQAFTEKTKQSEKRKSTQSPLSPHRLLRQLADEIDEFYEHPDSYDRKRMEETVRGLLKELKMLFGLSSPLQQAEDSIRESSFDIWKVLKKVRGLLRSDEVDEYGCDRALELSIKPLFDFLYYQYFRVTVKGIENVPREGRTLLVSNHSGVLPYDASMIKIAIYNEHPARREVRFLVDDFVFHFPFLGTFMNRIGGVRACPENAERLLSHEELVSVFPEGIKGISKPFKERYRLQRFGRGGVIRLALKTSSPIVPVAVIGAEEIHPLIYKSAVLARPLRLPFIPVTPTFPVLGPLGAIPLPTKWTIVFGKPISLKEYKPSDIHDGILINRETERLREVIQEMIYTELKERRSVFYG